MMQALKASVWRAVGLSPGCGRWWWGVRCRSTRGQRPRPFAPLAAGGDEGGPRRGGDGGGQLPPPAFLEVSEVVADSHSPRRGPAPQSRAPPRHRSYERGARPAAQATGDLSSPEGDFSRARKRLEQKPLSVERTKGSEIVFGIAPCALALTQSRRDMFRLFLKQSSGSQRLIMSEFVLQATARGVPVHYLKRRELSALCKGQVHQGVCLEATPLRFKSLEEAEKPDLGDEEGANRQLIWLALEHIQDPMNLGAVLRSAYFLGVDRVVTSQRNSCPLTPTVSKASSGAVEVFDIYSTDDLQSFLKVRVEDLFLEDGDGRITLYRAASSFSQTGYVSRSLRGCLQQVLPSVQQRQQHPGAQAHDGSIGQPLEHGREEKPELVGTAGNLFALYLCGKAKTAEGWEVVGTVSKPKDVENVPVISCSEFQWNKPVIIVIGSEGDGLSLETQLLCHRMLAIPPGRALHPGIESLNVSVATGILLHSICSQKLRHGD